jgi:surface antigen
MAACLAFCQFLGGCAIVSPVDGVDMQATGTIPAARARPSKPALPASLDEEDQRRALGALAIALDPQGNGATVHWDNPVSKARGSVTPTGLAYPANDVICRAFTAQFETSAGSLAERGEACRDKSAQWELSQLRPTKKD